MRLALPLLIIVLLAGCTARIVHDEISDPGKTVVPRGGNGIVLASEATVVASAEDTAIAPDLRVQLPEEYLPSQAFTLNLDLDETEEQIIVFKRRDDPNDLIRILVVSFDPIRNNWIKAWEGATAAHNVRSFTLYTDDLIGDHEQEIVCFGINNAGEQTLDVFRRTSNALGLGLAYTPIFSIAADVNITIEELQRSEAYEAMETISGQSFPVIVENRDSAASSVFATIKTSYFWDFSSRRYVRGFEEELSGEVFQDSRLRDLFAGTEAGFEDFLDGPWYRTTSDPDEVQMVFFGKSERTVVFHSGHLQQVFNWDDSAKTVYGRGIQLFVTNEILRSLKRLISVSVTDLNRISLVVLDTDGLDGTYDRLTESLQAAILDRDARVARLSEFQPRGLYTSDGGLEIVFGDPGFTYHDAEGQRAGGFALYQLSGDLVLELKFIDEFRLPVDAMRYSVEYDEVTDDDRLIRTMILQPGAVGIAGFSPSGDERVTLEQIELLQDE
jgi:pallilysin-like protein